MTGWKLKLQTKVKQKKCKVCTTLYTPRSTTQQVCSPKCAQIHAERTRKRLDALKLKTDRKILAEKKQSLKTRQQWFNECKTLAQKYARIRDKYDGCISCEKPATWNGQWHGSHFRPAGNNKAVALNLLNIHKSCSECNNFKSGNLIDYQDKLIKKIGIDKVNWLKSQTQTHTHTIEYLIKYKKVIGKKLRRMQNN
jgi:predicted nucleic acid-binding Zn ribbon protein